MCIPTKLQQNIIDRTREGDTIAAFLADTMQGRHTDAKFCHRLEAAKHLIRYGFPDAECETTSDRLSRAGGNPVGEGQGGDETPVQSPLSPGERAGVRGDRDCKANLPPRHHQLPDSPPHPPRDSRRSHRRRVSHSHRDRQRQAIHTQEVPHQARRPHGSSKRTPAPRLRRPRLAPQAIRHHRRSQTPTTPCTPTSPGECASTASAAPTPSASCSKSCLTPTLT